MDRQSASRVVVALRNVLPTLACLVLFVPGVAAVPNAVDSTGDTVLPFADILSITVDNDAGTTFDVTMAVAAQPPVDAAVVYMVGYCVDLANCYVAGLHRNAGGLWEAFSSLGVAYAPCTSHFSGLIVNVASTSSLTGHTIRWTLDKAAHNFVTSGCAVSGTTSGVATGDQLGCFSAKTWVGGGQGSAYMHLGLTRESGVPLTDMYGGLGCWGTTHTFA